MTMYSANPTDHAIAIKAIDATLEQYDFCLRAVPNYEPSSGYRDWLMRNVATLRAQRRHRVRILREMVGDDDD